MERFEAERLVKLRNKMAGLKESLLYMGMWFDGQEDDDVIMAKLKTASVVLTNDPVSITQRIVDECGTTCCALGYAGTMPEFRKRGLRLEVATGEWSGVTSQVSLYGSNGEFVTSDSFEAGRRFFGLNYDETQYLFNPEEYEDVVPGLDAGAAAGSCTYKIKPKHVVKHINRVLKDNDFGHLV